jgi:WhiB family transcriptional regulator, redox-sensing transcriptional regulator
MTMVWLRPSTIEKERWRILAECAGMDLDLFFPDIERNSVAAKEVCSRCLCWEECLIYAIENHIHFGIWGGMTARERKRVRRNFDQSSQLNNRGSRSHLRVAPNR